LEVRDTLSLHDVLDCPPSLRFGEVAVLVLDEGDDAPAYAKGSGEVFDILLRLSGYGGTGLCFTLGAPVSALAEPRSTT
jgi:hypothetical protein